MKTPKPFNPNHAAARLMALPPIQWPAAIAKLPPERAAEVTLSLDALAERAAFLAALIDGGEKKANQVQRKVSRALGYTYPERRGFRLTATV